MCPGPWTVSFWSLGYYLLALEFCRIVTLFNPWVALCSFFGTILSHFAVNSHNFLFLLVCTYHARFQRIRAFVSKTALSAEWEKDWKELDFEGDLDKLQKEAEDRLDSKIAELMSNIEKTGASGN